MQRNLQLMPIRGTLPSLYMPCHVRRSSTTAQNLGPLLSNCHSSTSIYQQRRSRSLIPSALGSSSDGSGDGDGISGQGWQGDGIGPEGIAEDPVLHDLIMGMGSSGSTGGQKPTGAPGKLFLQKLYVFLGHGATIKNQKFL